MLSRRAERGAVLVEAIIVSSLLIIIMGSGLFMHRLYFTKLQSIADARAAVWTQALTGCNAAVDLTGIWTGPGENPDSVDVGSDSAPSFFGDVDHTNGNATRSVQGEARLGGKSYALSSSATVACNEVAQNDRGGVRSLIGYVSSSVLPKFE